MMMVAAVNGEASAGEHHSGNVEAWKNLGGHATHASLALRSTAARASMCGCMRSAFVCAHACDRAQYPVAGSHWVHLIRGSEGLCRGRPLPPELPPLFDTELTMSMHHASLG